MSHKEVQRNKISLCPALQTLSGQGEPLPVKGHGTAEGEWAPAWFRVGAGALFFKNPDSWVKINTGATHSEKNTKLLKQP